MINSFNHLNFLIHHDREGEALEILIIASECDEVGLGHSMNRKGKRIGEKKANEILNLFKEIPEYSQYGFTHFEEIQLYIKDISKDRISDFACNFIKSFLIDFTIQASVELGIPLNESIVPSLYNYQKNKFVRDQCVRLPVNPDSKEPIIFVPKRWLRFNHWINFDEYFKDYCPKDDIFNPDEKEDPVKVLRYNRDHYGIVQDYVKLKERTQEDCKNDPLFHQIPVISAKRKLSSILSLPSGKDHGADRLYEKYQAQLLSSLFYPDLDFSAEQSRTDSGVLIRDLIFYNNRSIDFLQEIFDDYANRQLVFEMKNVKDIDRNHINQLNRYLDAGLGRFGVFVTRNPLSRAMFRNLIDLWSGQRRCIISLTDNDLSLMVNVFESKQRSPIDVLKKKYIEFRRACPA